MIDKVLDFGEKFVPPVVLFVIALPVISIWWALFLIGVGFIKFFIPFAYMDKVEAQFIAKFSPDGDKRRINREWLNNIKG